MRSIHPQLIIIKLAVCKLFPRLVKLHIYTIPLVHVDIGPFYILLVTVKLPFA